jgi:hypothetical protein
MIFPDVLKYFLNILVLEEVNDGAPSLYDSAAVGLSLGLREYLTFQLAERLTSSFE